MGVCRGDSWYISDWDSSSCEIFCELWWTLNTFSRCRWLYKRHEHFGYIVYTLKPTFRCLSSLAVELILGSRRRVEGLWNISEEIISFCQLSSCEEEKKSGDANWCYRQVPMTSTTLLHDSFQSKPMSHDASGFYRNAYAAASFGWPYVLKVTSAFAKQIGELSKWCPHLTNEIS